ncbi:MAG: outer membrane protein assembly factor BamC [Methyloprofundus sp.]|nr:outer membrane protein assembly factor BamC [Methyloprofundus sp.]MDT8425302.1 outer membrane protein assembly factor BamC [Methyloprofundus sp.]
MKLSKIIVIFSVTLVTACSSFFPDKEKDYVYSKEIAALEMPPNLLEEQVSDSLNTVANPDTLTNTIELIKDNEGSYLLINSPFAYVWRVVGKALTERAIEITDKDRSTAIYYVQYDPDVQDVQDGSFWDEVVFFFGDDPNQEKPYQVFLQQSEQGMRIFVRDEQGHNLSEGNGLHLLNSLFDTIKKDFETN